MGYNELVSLMTAILLASGRYDNLREAYGVADSIYAWVYHPQPIKRSVARSHE